ncbi:hypothetical protein RDI58_017553 [Solanum bulbocastanum]|uniref:Reverse transcriptase Ty1/copia-type domain-containing protein n=1 Tax=Solanum bulbocastanum TaxID=147425 RepID=A0AAN8TCJ4_SOLBU
MLFFMVTSMKKCTCDYPLASLFLPLIPPLLLCSFCRNPSMACDRLHDNGVPSCLKLCVRVVTHSMTDYSLFVRQSTSSTVILAVYDDDIILIGDDLDEISSLKLFLDQQSIKIKDLCVLNYFLGIEVAYASGSLLLHQRKFIHDLLQEFRCADVTAVTCPLDINVKLKANECALLPSPASYRSLVGKLNFLTHTRPNLYFAIQHLSQFLQAPHTPHMDAALHILRYLKGTSTIGVFFSNSPSLALSAYCDSDWGACPDTRRSVSGFCIFCDNQAAKHIARNLVFHERTKHIEVDCHCTRTKLLDGLISLHHVPTNAQPAG